MKKLKLFFFAVLTVSSIVASAQITDRNTNQSALLRGKFTRDQVWDAQRNPAYPSAGRDWQLSGLQAPFDVSTNEPLDWGRNNDRYLKFELEDDRSNHESSLIDDESRNSYSLTLQLYERNDRLVKTISKWGKLIGVGSAGFMYEQEGQVGTFFTVGRRRAGEAVTYRPILAEAKHIYEIMGNGETRTVSNQGNNNSGVRSSNTLSNRINNSPSNRINDAVSTRGNNNTYRNTNDNTNDIAPHFKSILLDTKYIKINTWDAQRNPAYPSAGRDWQLSGLQTPFDISTSGKLDWGRNNDRYLMFVLVADNSSNPSALTDDINNTRRKYNISLRLFERDGRLVKTVSRWGKLIGFGSGGFMYEQEDQIGTYFAGEVNEVGGSIIYRVELAQVQSLSAIVD